MAHIGNYLGAHIPSLCLATATSTCCRLGVQCAATDWRAPQDIGLKGYLEAHGT